MRGHLAGSAALVASWLSASVARADEVVWLEPPADPLAVGLVASAAGATGQPLDPTQLRGWTARWTRDDEARLEAVTRTLADVRKFETRLDGELLIMSELAAPLTAVSTVRTEDEAGVVFSALAYQGFAVDRFFEDDLSSEQAAPYRMSVDGVDVNLPWALAVALAPSRDVTAYEIAEAPQRIRYAAERERLVGQLPASLAVAGVPEGASLVIDGRVETPGAAGSVRVVPGRHFVNVQRGEQVLWRQTYTVTAGERLDVDTGLNDDAWNDWLASFDGQPTPPPAQAHAALDALGGSVWVARATTRNGRPEIEAWRIAADAVLPMVVDLPSDDGDARKTALILQAWVGAGWAANQDWYYQDPVVVRPDRSAVNAFAVSGGLGATWRAGLLDVGAGLDAIGTLGAHHTTFYGSSSTRVLLHPHVAIGVSGVDALLGFAFPHHLTTGVRVAIPLMGDTGLELRGGGLVGFNVVSAGAHPTWTGAPLFSAWGGLGFRLKP